MGRHRKVRIRRRIPLIVSAIAIAVVAAGIEMVCGPHATVHRVADPPTTRATVKTSDSNDSAATGFLPGAAPARPRTARPPTVAMADPRPTWDEQTAHSHDTPTGHDRNAALGTGSSASPGGGIPSTVHPSPVPIVPSGPNSQDTFLPYLLGHVVDNLVSTAA